MIQPAQVIIMIPVVKVIFGIFDALSTIQRVYQNIKNRFSFSSVREDQDDDHPVNPLTLINYTEILVDFADLIDDSGSKTEFIAKAMTFAKTTLRKDLWSTTPEDLKNEDCFVIQFVTLLADNINRQNVNQETKITYDLLVATIYSYNAAHVAAVLDNPLVLENIYTNTLTNLMGKDDAIKTLKAFEHR